MGVGPGVGDPVGDGVGDGDAVGLGEGDAVGDGDGDTVGDGAGAGPGPGSGGALGVTALETSETVPGSSPLNAVTLKVYSSSFVSPETTHDVAGVAGGVASVVQVPLGRPVTT